MPGKITQLTPLETRKQLLLIESELNRAQLLQDIGDLKAEIRRCKHQLGDISAVASSVAGLAATFNSVHQAFSQRDGEKSSGSWISTLFDGAKVGASLWRLVRSFGRKE